MARIESGAVKLKTEAVDLVDAISAALKDLRTSLPRENREVQHRPARRPAPRRKLSPAAAPLPHQYYRQCVPLLGEGPVRIAASVSRGKVRLSVEGEGPGLPQDEERALDAFMRVEESDRKGGAGLRLAIVQAFAEAIGSSVTASIPAQRPRAISRFAFPKMLVIKAVEPRCQLNEPDTRRRQPAAHPTLLQATAAAGPDTASSKPRCAPRRSALIDRQPDIVLSTLGFLDRDRLEVVAAMRRTTIRSSSSVSTHDQTKQKVAALDLGADDCADQAV